MRRTQTNQDSCFWPLPRPAILGRFICLPFQNPTLCKTTKKHKICFFIPALISLFCAIEHAHWDVLAWSRFSWTDETEPWSITERNVPALLSLSPPVWFGWRVTPAPTGIPILFSEWEECSLCLLLSRLRPTLRKSANQARASLYLKSGPIP